VKRLPTCLSATDVALIGGAAVIALLAVSAIVFTLFLERRHPQH
jgi:hypothetical protein